MKRVFVCGLSTCVLILLSARVGICQSPVEPLQEARTLLTAGRLPQAEEILRRHLKDDPTSAEAHYLLGDVLFRQQKARESLAEFTSGSKFKRPGAGELRTVASDYVLLGDFTDADKWFSEVTAETPNDAEAWYLLGRTKYNENRFAEAITSFEHVLTLRPKDIRAEDNLGLSQQGLDHTEQAKTAFQTAIAWQSGAPTDAQPYLNLGTLLTDQGDLAGAIPQLEKAATLAPDNPRIHEELGRALQSKGDMEGAQTQLEMAVKLAPNAAALHFKLGQIYRHRGLNERAQQEFAICAKLNGAHSSTEVPNPFSPTGSTKP
ncbi:MAG TPA: tetratricopeptide repeat protein [Edaphobacter sp.]|nr:tetratricopeptide repeat protein [Edaphobacter sp.]